MNRRIFLGSSALLAVSLLTYKDKALAQAMGTDPDPAPIGLKAVEAIYKSSNGNVVAMDSLLYIYDKSITSNDVIIAGSYCGAATLPHAIKTGVKAMIAHNAGVGKEDAGISALYLGEKHNFPVAAVECMSASISNGRSMAAGVISHANAQALALGVKPGQNVTEAAKLLLAAAPGKPSDVAVPFDKKVFEKGRVGSSRIFASSALTNLRPEDDHTNDVIAWGAHSGAIAADLVKKWKVKGWIGNDAGMAKNHTGIGGLPACNAIGVPAAAVSTMSARIGDGLSTYEDGIISAFNDLAGQKGLREGMKASEALQLLAA
ncbi:hypothetical protein [Aminobacter sp. SS-2016]|uniref:hypothetical protein n=1 Tax=Aminobacter sp. Y103A TaxID=1870862 RepID=UPI002573C15B|nr:hypothetical protein [Aminobacter sp. SS-2016]